MPGARIFKNVVIILIALRIEEAPGNARRRFTGIDINCDIRRVWSVLTNYEDLHKVIPSLVENEVV